MITTATEFAETTAFERLVFDRLKPVIAESGSDAIDLRQAMAGCVTLPPKNVLLS